MVDLLNEAELARIAMAREILLNCALANLAIGSARAIGLCGLLDNTTSLMMEIEAFMRCERRLAPGKAYRAGDLVDVTA